MALEKHFIKVVQSVYIPLIASSAYSHVSNYFSNGKSEENTQNHKTSQSLHYKAAKSFTSSVAADHFCSPLKSNFISHEICNMAVKNAMSYGVEGIYNNVNSMFTSKPSIDNQDYKLPLQEDLDNHLTQDFTSFSQVL
jgi:hypothetical protein